jgi:hypothetical protein
MRLSGVGKIMRLRHSHLGRLALPQALDQLRLNSAARHQFVSFREKITFPKRESSGFRKQ